MKEQHIVAFVLFLASIFFVMLYRESLAKKKSVRTFLRYIILAISLGYVGLFLKAQPTSTNIIILINSLRELQFPIGLFLMEPFIFLTFLFIALTMLVWGRGVFCGWLCPYGAMLELLNKAYQAVFPKGQLILPQKTHKKMIYIKYLLFLLILCISFFSFILSEYFTEIEPFRTFVLKLNREWYFVTYFMILTVGSLVIYRAFCLYLCPLGAALAIPSFFKFVPYLKLKRYDFCSRCKICAKTCAIRAIGPDGVVDIRECIDCLDCQENYFDDNVCPVLVRGKRQEEAN